MQLWVSSANITKSSSVSLESPEPSNSKTDTQYGLHRCPRNAIWLPSFPLSLPANAMSLDRVRESIGV